ncbi:alpha/beta hydrolase [Angustibacter sp. McL0619]|uniref:alpha/beta hydrolase n=1 Tax=Angustibacter sp. McL0619 TaxID=3415676 RepID=UPI003CF7E5EB
MAPSRRIRSAVVVLVCLAGASLTALPAASAAPADARSARRVGTLTLRPCDVVARALCGSIKRLWDPLHPDQGKVTVGFAFAPAKDASRPALGTLVPHEGGPGYSTTGTGSDYAAMYGPLLARRNLLLVDQRGTGRSEPLRCPALQNLKIAYNVAAGRCGRSLGEHSSDYTSALSADDLAAVVAALGLGRVDVYGDSYGTFFTQVFAGRHPDLVRTVVLDSAYPTYGETAWYPTQTPAMNSAFELVCRRVNACRTAGEPFGVTLRQVLDVVRVHPWQGVSHDADGRRMQVAVNAQNLAAVAFGATYGPSFYRELTAALRSGLAGDHAPLLRLVAEATGGGTNAGPVADYSEGLDAAVACHDYPQLYDMAASPAVRTRQYAQALADRTASAPNTYAPFTVDEYAASDWQSLDWCSRWPAAPADNPAAPPTPATGAYPNVPVLVLSGELDSITTAAEGRIVADQFPGATQVLLRNSFHVTAVEDVDHCAERILRAFVATPGSQTAVQGCAADVGPVRALGTFPRSVTGLGAGPAAAATVADLTDRWWNNYSGNGFGLRGGTWKYTGEPRVKFTLKQVEYVPGVAVSGQAVWNRFAHTMDVDLRLSGAAGTGHLVGAWDTRTVGADAVLTGTLHGHPVRLRFPAP